MRAVMEAVALRERFAAEAVAALTADVVRRPLAPTARAGQ